MRGLLISILTALFCLSAHGSPTLVNGAGATFPAPLYAKLIAEYRSVDTSVEINYQAIGSGGGVRQFLAGTTDYGATDDPMKDDEMKQAKAGVLHVPTVLGAVAITYNISGVSKAIKLTPEVLAAIYLGKITKWDDQKIKDLNPGVQFPSQFIVVAQRSDGSGTTALFTEYLASVSTEWANTVGKGKSVKFPTGLGGKGNEGVTGLVKQNPGAIGYVEMTFAMVNNLPMVSLKNKAGNFVEPSTGAVREAAAAVKNVPADFRVSLINGAGKGSYPIAAYTYLLLPKKMEPTKGKKLVEFVKWVLGPGQQFAEGLHFVGLPDPLLKRALVAVSGIDVK